METSDTDKSLEDLAVAQVSFSLKKSPENIRDYATCLIKAAHSSSDVIKENAQMPALCAIILPPLCRVDTSTTSECDAQRVAVLLPIYELYDNEQGAKRLLSTLSNTLSSTYELPLSRLGLAELLFEIDHSPERKCKNLSREITAAQLRKETVSSFTLEKLRKLTAGNIKEAQAALTGRHEVLPKGGKQRLEASLEMEINRQEMEARGIGGGVETKRALTVQFLKDYFALESRVSSDISVSCRNHFVEIRDDNDLKALFLKESVKYRTSNRLQQFNVFMRASISNVFHRHLTTGLGLPTQKTLPQPGS